MATISSINSHFATIPNLILSRPKLQINSPSSLFPSSSSNPLPLPNLSISTPPPRTIRTRPISSSSSSSFRYFEIDDGSPWEGAVVYKRDPSTTHLEYCTTLERLGLGKLSSDHSKTQASSIGLRVTKGVKDFPLGTPVQISMDVYRKKKKKLKLEGIVKTVITLGCNKCGGPAAKCVFSDFELLLSEEPIEEPDKIYMGNFYGDQIRRDSSKEEDIEENDLDLDDLLYFPPEEKEIDISKPIRDLIHVEITINEVCDPACKGMCLQCGVNLNKGNCDCGSKRKVYGSEAYTESRAS